MRAQFGNLCHVAPEGLGYLLGQAVDQVGIDGLETQCARLDDQIAHALERLHTVHGFFNLRVEVLDAETDAVEAQAGQMGQTLLVGRARVDLDGQLGGRRQPEALPQHVHPLGTFAVIQKRRRPATQVQLRQRFATAEFGNVQRHLLLQQVEVGSRA